jgi:hypothetical protein
MSYRLNRLIPEFASGLGALTVVMDAGFDIFPPVSPV